MGLWPSSMTTWRSTAGSVTLTLTPWAEHVRSTHPRTLSKGWRSTTMTT